MNFGFSSPLSVHRNLKYVPEDCKLGTSRERGSLTLSQFMKLISPKRFIEEKKETMSRRPSERNSDSIKVNRELLDKIKRVKPNCGFFCLLSDEKLHQNKNEIISPVKEHPVSLAEIFDRAKRVKRNRMDSDQERQNIAIATKAQSNCQAWFEHRRVRITASQSKRALASYSPNKSNEANLTL